MIQVRCNKLISDGLLGDRMLSLLKEIKEGKRLETFDLTCLEAIGIANLIERLVTVVEDVQTNGCFAVHGCIPYMYQTLERLKNGVTEQTCPSLEEQIMTILKEARESSFG